MLTDICSVNEAELNRGQYDTIIHVTFERDEPGRAMPLWAQSLGQSSA